MRGPRLRRQQLGERQARVERVRRGALGKAPTGAGTQLVEPLLGEVVLAGRAEAREAGSQLRRLQQAARLELVAAHRGVDERADDLLRRSVIEHAQPLGLETSRRRGVEHDPARDGRLRPQHHMVAARGHDRLRESELRVVPCAHQPGGHSLRPDVRGHRKLLKVILACLSEDHCGNRVLLLRE